MSAAHAGRFGGGCAPSACCFNGMAARVPSWLQPQFSAILSIVSVFRNEPTERGPVRPTWCV